MNILKKLILGPKGKRKSKKKDSSKNKHKQNSPNNSNSNNNSKIKILQEELVRKDQTIKMLTEKNNILFKTSLRQSMNISDLKQKISELYERLK